MLKTTLPAILGLALSLATGPALAGKMQTPPVRGAGYLYCDVFYSGSGRNVPVTIQVVNPWGVQATVTRKMGPNNRLNGLLFEDCEREDASDRCNPVACLFTFSVPAADISASATSIGIQGGASFTVPAE